MPGLPSVQASSDAYATIPTQFSTSLNEGWIPDVTIGATGNMVSNTSPTSSGYTISSSGDGTTGSGNGFYAIGRAVRLVQGATKVYGWVGSASFLGGITTISLSTASAILSSTATAVSAYVAPAITDSVPRFPTWTGPSGADSIVDLALNRDLIIKNNGTEIGRWLGNTKAIQVGSSAASSGFLRLPNSAMAIVGKTSTSGDDIIWPHQATRTPMASDTPGAAAYATLVTMSLGTGTWLINGAATVGSTAVTPVAGNVRLNDGSTFYASGFISTGSVGASTATAVTVSLSAIIANSSAFTLTMELGPTTTLTAYAIVPKSTSGAGSGTYLNAVKIG